jgi:GH24 family phage-related lysozyme (muramidase)
MRRRMMISPDGLALITRWEGYHKKLKDGRCTTYYCPAGVLTIGYGCTHGISSGLIWTHDEALQGLRRELDDVEDSVYRYVKVPLTQAQYDVLVSFTYNCGPGALKRSTLLRLLNRRDYEGARAQLIRWNKGGGRVLRGLTNRRRDEQRHWLKDVPDYFGDDSEPETHVPERKPDEVDVRGAEDSAEPPAQEPMAQSVDDPPLPREVLKKSRKFHLLQWLKRLFAGTGAGLVAVANAENVTTTKSTLDAFASFRDEYGLLIMAVTLVGGYFVAIWIEKYMADDVEEGRYEPSGEVEGGAA